MANEDSVKIVFFVLIAGRKKREAFLTALARAGLRLTNVIYGEGTAEANYLESLLGLVAEENKVVITGLLLKSETDAIFRMLIEQFDFDQPNTGVAFTMPIENLSF